MDYGTKTYSENKLNEWMTSVIIYKNDMECIIITKTKHSSIEKCM